MSPRAPTSWQADTAALPADLRAAEAEGVVQVVVGWTSPAGAGVTPADEHRFALAGFTEAYHAIDEACAATP